MSDQTFLLRFTIFTGFSMSLFGGVMTIDDDGFCHYHLHWFTGRGKRELRKGKFEVPDEILLVALEPSMLTSEPSALSADDQT
ncbi:MAG: hypothetical protein AAF633_22965, partial [Chloroflexota bacterium]